MYIGGKMWSLCKQIYTQDKGGLISVKPLLKKIKSTKTWENFTVILKWKCGTNVYKYGNAHQTV